MISPKEEAKELFDKFYSITGPFTEAKQCALIAVNKILKVAFYAHDDIYNHYLEVKIELEKL